jgi:hypothetical protein
MCKLYLDLLPDELINNLFLKLEGYDNYNFSAIGDRYSELFSKF